MADTTATYDALGNLIPGSLAMNPDMFPILPDDDDAKLEALCDDEGYLPSSREVGNSITYVYNTFNNVSESVFSQVISEVENLITETQTLQYEVYQQVTETIQSVQQTVEALVYALGTTVASQIGVLQEEMSILQSEILAVQYGGPVNATAVGVGGAGYGGSATATASGSQSTEVGAGATINVEVDQYGQPINYPGYPQPPGTSPVPTPPLPPIAPPGPVPPHFPPYPTVQPPFPRPTAPPGRYPQPVGVPPYTPGGPNNSEVPPDNCGVEQPHPYQGTPLDWDDVPEAAGEPSALPNPHPQMMPYSSLEIAATDAYARTYRAIVNALPDPPGAPCNWRVLDFVTMVRRQQRKLMGVTE